MYILQINTNVFRYMFYLYFVLHATGFCFGVVTMLVMSGLLQVVLPCAGASHVRVQSVRSEV